ncbi:MAG: Smr/MutS family protein [Pseudomonadota bacterium]
MLEQKPAPLPPKSATGDHGQPVKSTGGAELAYAATVKTAPQMDAKMLGKMKRGKIQPDARIDLHGMTVNQAHPALSSFIISAHASGKRLLLVITGQGQRQPDHDFFSPGRGVLRRQVPQWLRLPPVSSLVLEVTPAHRRHGGEGAYYVYLRRLRTA